MIYAYDQALQFPTMDLYDTLMMAMAVNAAKDMYDRGQQQIKDFYKEYGGFMSPFAKDMDEYGRMMGSVRNLINDAYSRGIDLARSPEGRALIQRAIYSVDPATYNMMRSNAKTGYAYLDAMQELRSKGKYSEAQELWDIINSKGTLFKDFGTVTPGLSKLNVWDRTSPIEAATLQELTRSGYEGRTARLLSASDFSDPRLAGYEYDPKYEWSGYLYSDLLKGAPGAINSASADPRMQYFRELARQKVAASGKPYSQADVEALFLRDVADANTWALIDPTRKANEFALSDYETNNRIRAHRAEAAIDYEYKHKDDTDPSNPSLTDLYSTAKDVFISGIAQTSGMLPYMPENGLDLNRLTELAQAATKRQTELIKRTGDVLGATGVYIDPDKLSSLIRYDKVDENGGYILTDDAVNYLHDIKDMTSSIKNWHPGRTDTNYSQGRGARKERKERTTKLLTGIRDDANYKKGSSRVKVVAVTDANGNNAYTFLGDDNRWHTYMRAKAYMTNGKGGVIDGGGDDESGKGTSRIPSTGKDLVIEVGLRSNRGAVSPDLSIKERERIGYGPFDFTKSKVGVTHDGDFAFGANFLKGVGK